MALYMSILVLNGKFYKLHKSRYLSMTLEGANISINIQYTRKRIIETTKILQNLVNF